MLGPTRSAKPLCSLLQSANGSNQPEQVFVLLTDAAAKHKHWEDLRNNLPNAQPVCIPDGKTESEYWQIFQAISDCVEEKDEFVFDITHGFRSIPLLAFLASAYLRSAKSMQLRHVLYGAYEAKTGAPGEERAPVFDLAPFLTLLDWTHAASYFEKTGDAKPLSSLISVKNNHLWASKDDSSDQPQMPRFLSNLSGSLRRLSEALLTVQVNEIPKAVQKLQTAISKSEPDVDQWASPFALIAEKVAQSYEPFSKHDL